MLCRLLFPILTSTSKMFVHLRRGLDAPHTFGRGGALSNELDQMDAHALILAIGAQATRKHALLESTSYVPQIILLLDPCRPRG